MARDNTNELYCLGTCPPIGGGNFDGMSQLVHDQALRAQAVQRSGLVLDVSEQAATVHPEAASPIEP